MRASIVCGPLLGLSGKLVSGGRSFDGLCSRACRICAKDPIVLGQHSQTMVMCEVGSIVLSHEIHMPPSSSARVKIESKSLQETLRYQ